MLSQIGQKPPSDFADPVGMLEDCHRRIRFFLKALTEATKLPPGLELSPIRRSAMQKALDYFREAAPKHTADEEESLFPRLRNHAHAHTVEGTLHTLAWEHACVEMEHHEIDELGRSWLATGTITETESGRLRDLLEGLNVVYERHIATEEREVFPVARRELSDSEKLRMGEEMAQRRGLTTRDSSHG